MSSNKFAIRFGLGAIKAVGLGMMESAVNERKLNGKFKDIYDFSERMDQKNINKKSIEALSKCGAFDCLNHKNRRQIFESFDILSAYANKKQNEMNSNQMNLFGAAELEKKPELKKVDDWQKAEKLQKEFEAFGFFLNEHPLDNYVNDLKLRGIVFSKKLESDELEDGDIIKIAGVVVGSKHRSSARGRFAYLTISDPFGIIETVIFDENLINTARDIISDGTVVSLECLIKKDDGGIRVLVKQVKLIETFLKDVKPESKPFEDIKKQQNKKEKKSQILLPVNFNNYEKTNEESNLEEDRENSFITSQGSLENLQDDQILSISLLLKSFQSIQNLKFFLENSLQNKKQKDQKTEIIILIKSTIKTTKIRLRDDYFLTKKDLENLKKIDHIEIVG
jgi:DNA polymerase III alpha subunit